VSLDHKPAPAKWKEVESSPDRHTEEEGRRWLCVGEPVIPLHRKRTSERKRARVRERERERERLCDGEKRD
jgi:hypothetical protein